jgi:hypothetical protein
MSFVAAISASAKMLSFAAGSADVSPTLLDETEQLHSEERESKRIK